MENDLPKTGLPADEEIAVAFQINNEMLFVLKNMLVKELLEERPKYHAAFDSTFDQSLKEISAIHARVSGFLFVAVAARHGDLKELDHAMSYATHAMKCIDAAIELLRSGFAVPPNILLRSAIEYFSAAVALLTSSAQREQFAKGKFSSTKAITAAKKAIPILGQIWGGLSSQFVHIGKVHATLQPNILSDKRTPPIVAGLNHVRASLVLGAMTAELIAIDQVDDPWFWKRQGLGQVSYEPSDATLAWLNEFWFEPDGEAKESEQPTEPK